MIKEIIVVEGRDDEAAVKAAVDAGTLATHGYGINQATLARIRKAYEGPGIIILTDPDHAGERIRERLAVLFPRAKHAHLSREAAEKDGDVGVENAAPENIRTALERARCTTEAREPVFSAADLAAWGLSGTREAAARRDRLGKALGIGYGNGRTFLKRLNCFGVTREEFELHGKALFAGGDPTAQ